MGGWGWKGKEDMYDSNQCECRKCEKKALHRESKPVLSTLGTQPSS